MVSLYAYKNSKFVIVFIILLIFILSLNINLIYGQELKVTGEHPFYSYSDNDWVKVKDLEVGDKLLTSNEGTAIITKITKINPENSVKVYNMRVGNVSDYYAEGVLVHNKPTKKIHWDDFLAETTLDKFDNTEFITKEGYEVQVDPLNGKIRYKNPVTGNFEDFIPSGDVNAVIFSKESPKDFYGVYLPATSTPFGEPLPKRIIFRGKNLDGESVTFNLDTNQVVYRHDNFVDVVYPETLNPAGKNDLMSKKRYRERMADQKVKRALGMELIKALRKVNSGPKKLECNAETFIANKNIVNGLIVDYQGIPLTGEFHFAISHDGDLILAEPPLINFIKILERREKNRIAPDGMINWISYDTFGMLNIESGKFVGFVDSGKGGYDACSRNSIQTWIEEFSWEKSHNSE